ncbi:HEAT repeat domain-containing protein [Streptomyces sp. NPDC001820]|uniref:HEAT repeat domain-containing protein n=1 Tax=Streptomyces sp. NPDC001820 TaxID=3364613 RepID=UPI0036A05B53
MTWRKKAELDASDTGQATASGGGLANSGIMLIREFHQHQSMPDTGSLTEAAPVIDAYAQRVQEAFGRVDLEVLTPLSEQGDHPPVELREVFVAPLVRADPPPVELPRELMKRLVENGELVADEHLPGIHQETLDRAREAYRQQPSLGILEVVADPLVPRMVLLGDPGAGKSTLARYLTLALTSSAPSGALAALAGCLPVVVELRRYAEDRWRERTFEDFLEYLHTTEGMCVSAAVLNDQLKMGRVLVIFDGLDELFDPAVRAETSRRITAFAARYPGVRIVVTSRMIGYQRTVFDSAHFKHYMLQDLTASQIIHFAQLWYANACPQNLELSNHLVQRVSEAVKLSRPVRELAGNPLLLTILAIIGRRQTLPRDRQGVYRHAVTVLVARWDQDTKHLKPSGGPEAMEILGAEERHELLRLLARRMQDGHAGIAGNHIHGRELEELFCEYMTQYELPPVQATASARFMVSQLRERNFILSRYGGEVYGFVHRAFLEYLAADDIAHRYKEDREWDPRQLITDVFERRAADPAWHEVLLLVVGMLHEQDSACAIDCLLSLHYKRQDDDDYRILVLAVQALGEVRKIGRLAAQSKAVVDALIAATSKASYASTPQLYSALPTLATFSEFWTGREHYLHWFHLRGQFLDTHIVGASPTDVAAALYQDSSRLRMLAVFGNGGANRSSAIRTLAAREPDRPDTLALLYRSAIEDPHYLPRAVAVEQLATHWPNQPDTLALLRECALEDPDDHCRAVALEQLATHWPNQPDTLALLRECALEDPDDHCRAVALEQLATHWPNQPDTLALLRDRAILDPERESRASALRMLAKHWPDRPDTLALLRECALEDPDDHCRAVTLELLSTHWSDRPDTRGFLRSRAIEDPDYYPRTIALEGLATHWPDQRDTLALFHDRAVEDSDGYARGIALDLWATHSPDKMNIYTFLRNRATEDTDDHCRGSALRMLARKWRDHPQTLEFLQDRAVEDPDDHCRSSALRMLAANWRDHPQTLEFLRDRAVRSDSRGPRIASLELLVTHWRDHPNTLELAYDRAMQAPDETLREAALKYLAAYWHDRPETIAASDESSINDFDPKRRLNAIRIKAAGQSDEDAKATVMHAMRDPSPLVRTGAIWMLAFTWASDPRTRDILRERAQIDDDEHVCMEARRALAATEMISADTEQKPSD